MPCAARTTVNISIGSLIFNILPVNGRLPAKTESELSPFRCGPKRGIKAGFNFLNTSRIKTGGLVAVKKHKNGYSIKREDFKGFADLKKQEAEYTGARNPYSINSFLRVLSSIMISRHGGLFVHASGAIIKGHAHIFAGKSGSGKSTVIKNMSDAVSLGDEIIGLKLTGEGAAAFSTPFGGELKSPRKNISVPVAGIYLLKKSKIEAVEDTNAGYFFSRFLRCVLNFSKEEDYVQGIVDLGAVILKRVPLRILKFKIKSNFSSILKEV